jgi:hypothetical protein
VAGYSVVIPARDAAHTLGRVGLARTLTLEQDGFE